MDAINRETSRYPGARQPAFAAGAGAALRRAASALDGRIRIAGRIAFAACACLYVSQFLSTLALLVGMCVMTVAASIAYAAQLRLRRLRCPRCGGLFFGAHANAAFATECTGCRLPRAEL